MTEIPAMMLWTDAYIGDTTHLTTLEHGAYMLILMAMWRAGGYLPNDDARLARTAKLSQDRWHKIAPTIREFFTVEGSSVTQKRLKLEFFSAQCRIKKYSDAGRAGGIAKSLKNNNTTHGDATVLPVAKRKRMPSLSYPLSLKKETNKEAARRFYEAYPKHVDPRSSERKFFSIVKSGVDPEIIITAAERFTEAHRMAGTDKQFIPAPAVWLNKGGYSSEDLPKPAGYGNVHINGGGVEYVPLYPGQPREFWEKRK